MLLFATLPPLWVPAGRQVLPTRGSTGGLKLATHYIIMDTVIRETIWKQFGASIGMLKNALLHCPEEYLQTNRSFFSPGRCHRPDSVTLLVGETPTRDAKVSAVYIGCQARQSKIIVVDKLFPPLLVPAGRQVFTNNSSQQALTAKFPRSAGQIRFANNNWHSVQN